MAKFTLCTMIFSIITWFGSVESIYTVGLGCSPFDNSTVNAVYQSNLRTLLDSLSTNVSIQDGFFYNASVGDSPDDRVYGLAWCRGDLSRDTCSECLNMTISVPLEECPESKDYVIWSSTCSLRFKNSSFFGEVWNGSTSASYGSNGLDDPFVFPKGFSMMESLAKNVSNGLLMFERSVVDVGNDEKRYGLGQCSRDLSKLDCRKCLEWLLMSYQKEVLNQTGWEMHGVNCGLWYDDDASFSANDTWITLGSDASSELTMGADTSGYGERWCKGEMILALIAFLMFF